MQIMTSLYANNDVTSIYAAVGGSHAVTRCAANKLIYSGIKFNYVFLSYSNCLMQLVTLCIRANDPLLHPRIIAIL